MIDGAKSNENTIYSLINANLRCNNVNKLYGLVKCYSNVEIYGEKIRYLYYKYIPRKTLRSIPNDLNHIYNENNNNNNLIKLANKSSFIRNTIKNKYSDSNCSIIYNQKYCYYYFQTILNERTMSNRRRSILSTSSTSSRRAKHCNCLDFKQKETKRSPDVYRSILGPTPDESILAGLQTVIDMCGILENTTQAIERVEDTYYEYSNSYDAQREHYNISPPEPPCQNDFESIDLDEYQEPREQQSNESSVKFSSHEISVDGSSKSDVMLEPTPRKIHTPSPRDSVSKVKEIDEQPEERVVKRRASKHYSKEKFEPKTVSDTSIVSDKSLEAPSKKSQESVTSTSSICSHTGKKRSTCNSCKNRLTNAKYYDSVCKRDECCTCKKLRKEPPCKKDAQQQSSFHSRDEIRSKKYDKTCNGECCKCRRKLQSEEDVERSPIDSKKASSDLLKKHSSSSSHRDSRRSSSSKSDKVHDTSSLSINRNKKRSSESEKPHRESSDRSRQLSELSQSKSVKSKSSKNLKDTYPSSSKEFKTLDSQKRSVSKKLEAKSNVSTATNESIGSQTKRSVKNERDVKDLSEKARVKSQTSTDKSIVSRSTKSHKSDAEIEEKSIEKSTSSNILQNFMTRLRSKSSNLDAGPGIEHHNITPADFPETILEEPDNVQQVSYSTVANELQNGNIQDETRYLTPIAERSNMNVSLENIPTSTPLSASSSLGVTTTTDNDTENTSGNIDTTTDNSDDDRYRGQGDFLPVTKLNQRSIRYACTKITDYDGYRTYEILNVPVREPKKCKCVQSVFVVKKKS